MNSVNSVIKNMIRGLDLSGDERGMHIRFISEMKVRLQAKHVVTVLNTS